MVCPDAICYDKISTSIGKGYLSDYYYARNALYFMAKFRKFRLPSALFFMSLRWLRRLFAGQRDRASEGIGIRVGLRRLPDPGG